MKATAVLSAIFTLIVVLFSCVDEGKSALKENRNIEVKKQTRILTPEEQVDSIVRFCRKEYDAEVMFDEYKRLDFNFDGKNDLAVFVWGTGTGPAHRTLAFVHDTVENCFVPDEQLSNVMNAEFDPKKQQIDGFYVGHGGGDAVTLKWTNGQWDTTEYVTIEPHETGLKWLITRENYLTHKKTRKTVDDWMDEF